jgi:hypothetical protein
LNAPSRSRGGPLAAVLSATIGALALVACLMVVLLTDDDLDLGGTDSTGMPGLPGGGGSDSADDSADDSARAEAVPEGAGGDAGPDLSECTETECPALDPPDGPATAFPFPPGSTLPRWTDDFCSETRSASADDIREVRMSLTEARDWYLTHLTDAGYGWGGAGTLRANPFTTDDAGNRVVLGWEGVLTTSDSSRSGRLSLEHEHGGQTTCGPAPGVVHITVVEP